MRIILLLAASLITASLTAFTITDIRGLSQDFEINDLAALPRLDLNTSSEKEGRIKEHSFSGIRFDHWIQEQGYSSFGKSRFESGARYRVILSKAELDSLECWLVFASGGKEYESGASRLVFPGLREMTWIKDVERVLLEARTEVPIPHTYHRLDLMLQTIDLLQDPAPFVNMEGWYLANLLPSDSLSLYLISGDGLLAELEWPQHLEGAILEKHGDLIDLKSPQIPGGMWIKDLVYIQFGSTVLIRDKALPQLNDIETTMGRIRGADTKVLLADGMVLPLGKLMLEPSLGDDSNSFMIIEAE